MKNALKFPATDEQLDKVLSNKAMLQMVHQSRDLFVSTNLICIYPDLDTWTVFLGGDENECSWSYLVISTSWVKLFVGDPRGNLKKLCVI